MILGNTNDILVLSSSSVNEADLEKAETMCECDSCIYSIVNNQARIEFIEFNDADI
jgi:hypothetical protein